MEEILRVVSRILSVAEVMQVFKGDSKPIQRLQIHLEHYIKHDLLRGKTPTLARMDEAVDEFLANCMPSLRAAEVRASCV